MQKLRSLQQDAGAHSKWTAFCKVHGHGVNDANHHDLPFLMTFFEAYESGSILEEPSWNGGGSNADAGGDEGAASAKIFVGGLPKGCAEATLWHHFAGWGPVAKVEVKVDEMGQPRGFAFVTFHDPAHAKQVLDNKDHNKLEGKWIDCKSADGSGKGGKGGKDGKGASDDQKIFAGGLPKTATEDTVKTFFSYYGPIDSINLKFDPQGMFRGFGFITFQSAESAAKVLASPSMEFEGKWIECKPATQKEKGAGEKGGSKDQGGKGASNAWSASGGEWSGGSASGGGWQDQAKSSSGGWQEGSGGASAGGASAWSSSADGGGDNSSQSWKSSAGGEGSSGGWQGGGSSWADASAARPADSAQGAYGAAPGGSAPAAWGQPY